MKLVEAVSDIGTVRQEVQRLLDLLKEQLGEFEVHRSFVISDRASRDPTHLFLGASSLIQVSMAGVIVHRLEEFDRVELFASRPTPEVIVNGHKRGSGDPMFRWRLPDWEAAQDLFGALAEASIQQ